MQMEGVILFGVGSPIVPYFEESLHRAGQPIAADIRNRPGPHYLSEDVRILSPGGRSDPIAAGEVAGPLPIVLSSPQNNRLPTARLHMANTRV